MTEYNFFVEHFVLDSVKMAKENICSPLESFHHRIVRRLK